MLNSHCNKIMKKKSCSHLDANPHPTYCKATTARNPLQIFDKIFLYVTSLKSGKTIGYFRLQNIAAY